MGHTIRTIIRKTNLVRFKSMMLFKVATLRTELDVLNQSLKFYFVFKNLLDYIFSKAGFFLLILTMRFVDT